MHDPGRMASHCISTEWGQQFGLAGWPLIHCFKTPREHISCEMQQHTLHNCLLQGFCCTVPGPCLMYQHTVQLALKPAHHRIGPQVLAAGKRRTSLQTYITKRLGSFSI